MANNKVQLADGTVLMDITGSTVTPETMVQGTRAYNAAGNPITGNLVITDIQTLLNGIFPVGCIYANTSSVAPTFVGTWQEVKVRRTWDDMADGESNFAYGSGTGNLHFWRRDS